MPVGVVGRRRAAARIGAEVEARGLPVRRPPPRSSSRSTRPTASSSDRSPRAARCSRTSSAMNSKKFSTNSGLPVKRLRSSGFWVAIPTGTGVEVADPHHDAARHHQRAPWRSRTPRPRAARPTTTSRPVFSCPSTWTTMRSRSPLATRVCWVSARPSSQGMPACLSEVSGAGPGPPVVARDEHHVGLGLGHPGGHRAHPDLGHQLHVHPGPRVGRLEVVDELGDVLDGVDVVVRRRRDQPDARASSTGSGDPRVDLVPRQLAALAGLGPLGDLDLEVVGVHQVLARHPEAARGHLLDGAAPQVAVGVGGEAVGVLAALAGVGLPADAVHGDGQGLVGLGRDRPVGHGPGGEALHDVGRPARPRRSGPGRQHARRAARSRPRRVARLVGLVVDQRWCTP